MRNRPLGKGRVSRAVAEAFAIEEYQIFRQDQLKKYQSDFDLYALEKEVNEKDDRL